jgi:hypothetical protein
VTPRSGEKTIIRDAFQYRPKPLFFTISQYIRRNQNRDGVVQTSLLPFRAASFVPAICPLDIRDFYFAIQLSDLYKAIKQEKRKPQGQRFMGYQAVMSCNGKLARCTGLQQTILSQFEGRKGKVKDYAKLLFGYWRENS